MNVSFISLGCDKNRVNTEQMMAMCLQAGMTVQEDVNGSDVVVINTCGFIDSAKTEAIETILSAAPTAVPTASSPSCGAATAAALWRIS